MRIGSSYRRTPISARFSLLRRPSAHRSSSSGIPNLLVAQDCVNMLLPSLRALEPELMTGCVAVFRNSRLGVRKLPFAG